MGTFAADAFELLTLLVSTPPYLARTLGSWMVSRLVPVTVITVLPLRTHKQTHTFRLQINNADRSVAARTPIGHVYLGMVQLGSMLVMVGSSV